MAVYIKGMKMSKDCTECTLNYLDNFGYPHCGVTKLVIVEGKTKGGCPLIEVPEPHGRLIDADALKYYGVHIGDEYEDRFHDYQRVDRSDIDNAPTVIEGSK